MPESGCRSSILLNTDVHLTLNATFQSLSPLDVQESDKTHKVGVPQSRTVITVEVAGKNHQHDQQSFCQHMGREPFFC